MADDIRPAKAGPAWDRIFIANGVRPSRLERLVARDAYEAGLKDAAAKVRAKANLDVKAGPQELFRLENLAQDIEP